MSPSATRPQRPSREVVTGSIRRALPPRIAPSGECSRSPLRRASHTAACSCGVHDGDAESSSCRHRVFTRGALGARVRARCPARRGRALEILVVMQSSGLPEAGDMVITFAPEVLDDPVAYAKAHALPRARRPPPAAERTPARDGTRACRACCDCGPPSSARGCRRSARRRARLGGFHPERDPTRRADDPLRRGAPQHGNVVVAVGRRGRTA